MELHNSDAAKKLILEMGVSSLIQCAYNEGLQSLHHKVVHLLSSPINHLLSLPLTLKLKWLDTHKATQLSYKALHLDPHKGECIFMSQWMVHQAIFMVSSDP